MENEVCPHWPAEGICGSDRYFICADIYGQPVQAQEYGMEEQIRQVNHKLVAVSRKAASGRALVAGDLTMTGEQLAPIGSMELEELIAAYKEQIILLEEAGVDLLVVETMMSLQESRAALIAAKETCSIFRSWSP
ncbi:MAG: homocysteine S-methyltransferase family protein [Eisenbergiella sp.]